MLSLVTRSDDNGPCCGPRHTLHRVREGVGPPVAGETLRLREAEVTQLISGRARTGLHGCLTPHTEFRSCGEFSADTSKSVPMIRNLSHTHSGLIPDCQAARLKTEPSSVPSVQSAEWPLPTVVTCTLFVDSLSFHVVTEALRRHGRFMSRCTAGGSSSAVSLLLAA